MGCLANFVSPKWLLDSGELSPCDIIEFNRLTYSHYGFYIGDGICVHVTGPDSGMGSSSSSSKKFPKGTKQAEMLISIAGSDYRYNKVRINNCVLFATTLGYEERPRQRAIDKALEGLKRDSNSKVILEEPISYNYHLVGNNCESFATRCRYDCIGFSIQAANPSMNSTLGTVERATSAIRHDLADVVSDNDQNVALRAGAAVAYTGYAAVGWSAYGVKTSTDAIVGGAVKVLDFFSK